MKTFVFLIALSCLGSAGTSIAQPRTVGLLSHNPASDDSGYVLFSPLTWKTTYLIDKCGKVINFWNSNYFPFSSAYLREDGSLARTGILGGTGSKQVSCCTEIYDWAGHLKWSYTLDSVYGQHHDFEVMPNGNVLLISHALIDSLSIIADGRDPALISGDFVSERLVEVQPVGTDSGKIVWEWKVSDHLVQDFDNSKSNFGSVSGHPELININYPANAVGEWLHFNSVRYNAALDQILVSAHHSSEIWIIDHNTTTAQAASHSGGKHGRGGDLLYRWGNPAAYNHGTVQDQKLFGQHECLWIKAGRPQAGKIMLFNNGTGRPGGIPYASVEVITPPVDTAGNYDAITLPMLPVAADWTYTDNPPSKIETQTAGGAEMLPNGDVMVCTGQMGGIFELDPTRTKKLWKYASPVNNAGPMTQGVVASNNPIYKSEFYPSNYPAFAGRTLAPGSPVELGSADYDCFVDSALNVAETPAQPESPLFVYPNPASNVISLVNSDHRFTHGAIVDVLGRTIVTFEHGGAIDISRVSAGIYHLVMLGKHGVSSKMITIAR